MATRKAHIPKCIVIAGPNGAGKTTFAREFLPRDRGVLNYVNADLIALRVCHLCGRRWRHERLRGWSWPSLIGCRTRAWKDAGYRIEIVFLQLSSPQLALKRIASRVAQGGHDVPRADVLRRFTRGRANLEKLYLPLADSWALYDNSGAAPTLVAKSP